eukprot:GHVP01064007.1.p1 GENE.GHVP01064007.1~~GHVP01064007.1.p1  ORF type:complete len:159 (-),score=18.27 GHVP01064007.1:344-820(-)
MYNSNLSAEQKVRINGAETWEPKTSLDELTSVSGACDRYPQMTADDDEHALKNPVEKWLKMLRLKQLNPSSELDLEKWASDTARRARKLRPSLGVLVDAIEVECSDVVKRVTILHILLLSLCYKKLVAFFFLLLLVIDQQLFWVSLLFLNELAVDVSC